MENYIEEVDANFEGFFTSSQNSINTVITELLPKKEEFKKSYRRLVSLRAWRGELLEGLIEPDAEAFFKEAHNDALMSHALARQGAWRVALMSLRSCIENTLFGLYYCEHPVELELWKMGSHKLGCSESVNYLIKHPLFIGVDEALSGIGLIKGEYATLSKAVHGSSESFRVTKTGLVEGLNISSEAELGAWATRERNTILSINRLLLTFFRSELTGAAKRNLRKAISLVVPEEKHREIKNSLGVSLKALP